MMLAAYTLWNREVTRFFRQSTRIIGALATPVIFWAMMGAGFRGSYQGDYSSYLFPGALVMVLMFTAIFSTISIIEDRREGFLQGVLVAPVSRASIVLGKVAGGGTIALVQATLFLCLGLATGVRPGAAGLAAALGVLALLGFTLTSLGTAIAWRFRSIQGFHAIMNLFLMPMWVLSGAVFPLSGAAGWLKPVMMANPLTYGVSAVRNALEGRAAWTDIAISAGFGVVMFAVATAVASKEES